MKHNIGIIFPGSGSQYVGMGKNFYDNFKVVRETYEEASDILNKDFEKICFKGGVVKQNKIENLLPSIYVTSVALSRVLLNEFGVIPSCSAGHSLGEYSALTAAGAFEFNELLKVVQFRSDLAKKAAKEEDAGMAIINGASAELVDRICKEYSTENKCASIACFNTSEQFLISGHNEIIDQVTEQAKKEGANIILMIGSAPYHSILLKNAAFELKEKLEECSISVPKWDVISNISLKKFKDRDDIINNLVLQMYNPIQWRKVIQKLKTSADMLIEAGPNNVLSLIVKESLNFKNVSSFDKDFEDIKNRDFKYFNDINYANLCLKFIASSPNCAPKDDYDVNQVSNIYKEVLEVEDKVSNKIIKLEQKDKKYLYEKVIKAFELKNISPQDQKEMILKLNTLA